MAASIQASCFHLQCIKTRFTAMTLQHTYMKRLSNGKGRRKRWLSLMPAQTSTPGKPCSFARRRNAALPASARIVRRSMHVLRLHLEGYETDRLSQTSATDTCIQQHNYRQTCQAVRQSSATSLATASNRMPILLCRADVDERLETSPSERPGETTSGARKVEGISSTG